MHRLGLSPERSELHLSASKSPAIPQELIISLEMAQTTKARDRMSRDLDGFAAKIMRLRDYLKLGYTGVIALLITHLKGHKLP